MFNKKGEIAVEKVITLIIVLLVIVVATIFIFKPDILNWMRNLPEYTYNDTDRELPLSPDQLALIGCEKLVGRIGGLEGSYFSPKNFISIGGKKTELYIENNNALRLSHKDELVASIRDKTIQVYPAFLDKYSQTYIELSTVGLPSMEELRLIDNAFILNTGNYICKSEKAINEIKENEKCVAKCSLYNGECSAVIPEGKVANGKIDCKDGELCYVSETETKLTDNDLKLEHLYVYDLTKSSYQDMEDFVNKDSISLYKGKHISFSMRTNSSTPYCFFLDSDAKFIYGSYVEKGPIPNNYPLVVTTDYYHELSYSGEKLFEFVAWDPNNPSKKVIKRINVIISNEFPKGYDPAEIVPDSKLKEAAQNAKKGEFFYIFQVTKDWIWREGIFGAGAMTTKNYKISKTSSSAVSISAFDESKNEWHSLDCNLGMFTVGKSIYVENLENSLSATFVKDKCKY